MDNVGRDGGQQWSVVVVRLLVWLKGNQVMEGDSLRAP